VSFFLSLRICKCKKIKKFPFFLTFSCNDLAKIRILFGSFLLVLI
jgi:hypothetical protein